jgi:hypothetical protein
MRFLTEDAVVVCKHELGRLSIEPTNSWVTISRRRVLVERNPEGRPIRGCPNIAATIKPCTRSLAVTSGYSGHIRIDGRRVCLDTVKGLTDGTPPGVVEYYVRAPGQRFVEEVHL